MRKLWRKQNKEDSLKDLVILEELNWRHSHAQNNYGLKYASAPQFIFNTDEHVAANNGIRWSQQIKTTNFNVST